MSSQKPADWAAHLMLALPYDREWRPRNLKLLLIKFLLSTPAQPNRLSHDLQDRVQGLFATCRSRCVHHLSPLCPLGAVLLPSLGAV